MVLQGSINIFTTSDEQFGQVTDSLAQQSFQLVEADLDGGLISSGYVPNLEGTSILSSEDINDIPSQDQAGSQLVDVRYSNAFDGGLWIGVYRADALQTSSFTHDNFADFAARASEQSGIGLSLVDLEYGDGNINAIYADTHVDRANGTYIASNNLDDFTGQVNANTVTSPVQIGVAPFDLVDIEYIDGTYVGVLGDFRGRSDYVSNIANFDEFQAEIQRQQSIGFDLVDAEFINGAWHGVFNDNQDINDITSADFV